MVAEEMTETEETIRYLDKLCYHKTPRTWGIAVTIELGTRFIAIQLDDGQFLPVGYDEPMGGFKLLEWLSQYPCVATRLAEPIE